MYKMLPILFLLSFWSCKKDQESAKIELLEAFVGSTSISLTAPANNIDIAPTNEITLRFSSNMDSSSVRTGISMVYDGEVSQAITPQFPADSRLVKLNILQPLNWGKTYEIRLSPTISGQNGAKLPATVLSFTVVKDELRVISLKINDTEILNSANIKDIPVQSQFTVTFNKPIEPSTLASTTVNVFSDANHATLNLSLDANNTVLTVAPTAPLEAFKPYFITLSTQIKPADQANFAGLSKNFFTSLDTTDKFPQITDDELLTKIQQQTFTYFWDFGHPVSGLARERNSSGDIVTSGGSGFGLMSIVVGIERGFITRSAGIARLTKITDFLATAERFHGAWPHWLNGATGKVVPFSPNDNGADLVETSYLVQGLLTVRQYLNPAIPEELALKNNINALCDGVEWDWFTRGGQNVLYWHWSADKGWIMNMQIKGWNECLITYFLAAGSNTHAINAPVYHQGWAGNGSMKNGHSFYGINLPLGWDYGGPLFFSHYSFLGLNPTNLQDQYANYWEQTVNHARINHQYCVANPKGYALYSDKCWGLTASDNQNGYNAHSPTDDLGVISPTAAVSSLPYTPDESMKAIRFFYYKLGDKLWKEHGFVDAFNPNTGWFADSFLAIDQGPMIVMIENYRSQLLWNLFMSSPEVAAAKTKLGFQ